jgi:hypothetical protein
MPRARPVRDLAGDGAVADEAQEPAGGLAADQERARPASLEHGGGGREGATQEHERGGDHVLGHGGGVGACGRQHRDAAGTAGGEVDVVEADAEPAHDLEALGGREQGASDLGAIADDERTGARRHELELGRTVDERRVVVHLEVAAQVLDRRLVHELADDDVEHRPGFLLAGASALYPKAQAAGSGATGRAWTGGARRAKLGAARGRCSGRRCQRFLCVGIAVADTRLGRGIPVVELDRAG